MLMSLRKNIQPCLILLVKQKGIDAYVINDLLVTSLDCGSVVYDFIIFNIQSVAFNLLRKLKELNINNPEIIISIDSKAHVLTDTLYGLDDYYNGTFKAVVIKSCFKFFAAYVRHEVKMQCLLLTQLVTRNKVTLATDYLFLIELLKHHGHLPPIDCNTVHDLEKWIENTYCQNFAQMGMHLAIKNLYLANHYEIS